MTQSKPLSPAAQAVLDAYLDQDTINFQGRDALAAALRALVANVMNVLRPAPCPFCGSSDVRVIEGDNYRWRVARCFFCSAQSGDVRIQTTGEGSTEEWETIATVSAIREWNKRADHPDTKRLMYLMNQIEGFGNVKNDRYDFASICAAKNGRDEPTMEDDLSGFRKLIDCAIEADELESEQ
jgi:hypothetical protein